MYGGIGLAIIGVIYAVLKFLPSFLATRPAKSIDTTYGSDNAPPAGAVAWVSEMVKAAGFAADPKFVLEQLLAGSTKSELMESRIAQLEQPK